MSDIMGVTTNTIKEHIGGGIYVPTSASETNNNHSKAILMYPYAGDDGTLLSKFADSTYKTGELTPRLKTLPSGYLSISSFAKSYVADSEGLFSSSPSESDFWSPPLGFFITNKRRRKISVAQEALPTLNVESKEENNNKNDSGNDTNKVTSLKLSEFIPSLSSISLPKLPERSWFCNTCRKPKDECHCLCVIC